MQCVQNSKDLEIIEIDSIKVYKEYLYIYVTRKLIAMGIEVSNSGFGYFRDILIKMLSESTTRKPLRKYFEQVSGGRVTANQIDKAISFTLNMSYIKSNGFFKLKSFMGGNVIDSCSNAKIFYIMKEYIRYCLYDDYICCVEKSLAFS